MSLNQTEVSSYPGWCWGCWCGGGGGGRGEGGATVWGWGGGAGGRGVAGARLGASAPGAEGGQTLRRSFRKDELLPQLQVGATTSWTERQKQENNELVCLCQLTGFLQQGAAEAASRVRERVGASWAADIRVRACFIWGAWAERGVWRGWGLGVQEVISALWLSCF